MTRLHGRFNILREQLNNLLNISNWVCDDKTKVDFKAIRIF